MKILFTALSMLIFSVAASEAQVPIVYKAPGSTLVIEAISKPVSLLGSSNPNYLDQPFTYNCMSSEGCAVSAITEVQLKLHEAANTLCVYVDGTPMMPACSPPEDELYQLHNLQGQLIGQGSHTLQTGINFPSHGRGKACPCTITYTIYDNGIAAPHP
jgi:hypothetical protein